MSVSPSLAPETELQQVRVEGIIVAHLKKRGGRCPVRDFGWAVENRIKVPRRLKPSRTIACNEAIAALVARRAITVDWVPSIRKGCKPERWATLLYDPGEGGGAC